MVREERGVVDFAETMTEGGVSGGDTGVDGDGVAYHGSQLWRGRWLLDGLCPLKRLLRGLWAWSMLTSWWY